MRINTISGNFEDEVIDIVKDQQNVQYITHYCIKLFFVQYTAQNIQ